MADIGCTAAEGPAGAMDEGKERQPEQKLILLSTMHYLAADAINCCAEST